jgi:hypothetical protein
MRPDIYRKLAPHVTVFSRQPGFTSQLASREVLLSVPGVNAATVDAYIAQRQAAREAKQPVPIMREAQGFSANMTTVVNIRAQARLDDGTVFAREAIALLRPTPRKAVTFLAWRQPATVPVDAQADALAEKAR